MIEPLQLSCPADCFLGTSCMGASSALQARLRLVEGQLEDMTQQV
jgi:hypothetical protein